MSSDSCFTNLNQSAQFSPVCMFAWVPKCACIDELGDPGWPESFTNTSQSMDLYNEWPKTPLNTCDEQVTWSEM